MEDITKTNLEKITASEETLAEFISGLAKCQLCPCYTRGCGNCKEHIKQWLESECEK